MSERSFHAHEAVTVVFTWQVAPGKDDDFRAWAHGMEAAAAGFPGHRGVTWLRPERNSRRYHAVVRFADAAALDRWMASPERAAWQARARHIAKAAHPRMTTTGLETWFNVPGVGERPPARWKMSLVTILGVYPFALLYDGLVAEYFRSWPLGWRTLVFPAFLAFLLTYAIMPWLSRLFRRWLYPGA